MHYQRLGLETKEQPIRHRHDEHPSVGQPTKTTGSPGDGQLGLDRASEVDCPHRMVEEVTEPQLALVPARTLTEVQPVCQKFDAHLLTPTDVDSGKSTS